MSDRDKYRVYDKSNEVYIDDTMYITPDGELVVIGEGSDGEPCFVDTDDYIVEKCTGVKDINGKLIYEGDIVSSSNRVMGIQRIGVIEYHYDGFIVTYHDGNGGHCIMNMCEPIEIIGNIHEVKRDD